MALKLSPEKCNEMSSLMAETSPKVCAIRRALSLSLARPLAHSLACRLMSSIFQSDTLGSSRRCRSVVSHVSFCFSAQHSGSHQLLVKWNSVGHDGAAVSPVVVRSPLMEAGSRAPFHPGPSLVATEGAACHCQPAGGNIFAPKHVV